MSENNLIQFLNQYDTEVKLLSTNENVFIKPITTGQMKKVLSYENNDDQFVVENILDDIINDCVVSDNFHINDITLQDRFDLLINIRKITKGDDYLFNIICPSCKTELMNTIRISELEVVSYPKDINNKIQLSDNMTICVNYITRGMQKEAINIVKKRKNLNKDQQMAEMGTYIYALAIDTFETPAGSITDASTEHKKELLDNLSESLMSKISEWYTKYDYGIKFKYTPDCRFCEWGGDNEEDIPLTGFFF